jgi:hypothetical protein
VSNKVDDELISKTKMKVNKTLQKLEERLNKKEEKQESRPFIGFRN